jgi:hypothetical protein
VARCVGKWEAGYAHPLAPQRIPTSLALEVEAGGKTSLAQAGRPFQTRETRQGRPLPGSRIKQARCPRQAA